VLSEEKKILHGGPTYNIEHKH